MKTDIELTWKTVFNAGLRNWGHIDYALGVAESAGYNYIAWNDRIYTMSGRDTGLTVQDVK